LENLKDRYNGFSFDGKQLLYNPFSMLSFFHDEKFSNYWMESGSNTLIRKFLMNKGLTADQFQGINYSYNSARTPGEIEATPPEGFLYQSGYLTLRYVDEMNFTLEYPNREVREAISILFLETVGSKPSDIDAASAELSGCLASVDISGIISVLARLLAGICYNDHLDALRSPVARTVQKVIRIFTGQHSGAAPLQEQSSALADFLLRSKGESYYRSLLQACFWMAGAKVNPEKKENLGRLDLEVYFAPLTYVIELKLSKNAKGGPAAVREGMDHIHERGYGLASKNPIFVSVAIGRAERNIVCCLFEKDGHETFVKVDLKDKAKPSISHEKN
jgi:hypothetical protein